MDTMSMLKVAAQKLKDEEQQMSIINDMLNEKSTGMQASKIRIIEIDSIFKNPLNKMPIENIEEMIQVLTTDGQLVPLIVYKEANNHYVLISGERRWTAMKHEGFETAPCVIIDKPENEWEERLAIEAANSQREDTAEIQKLRAENYAAVYDGYKELGKIPYGVLKRDWIGERMNLSGRQVQRYLTSDMARELDGEESQTKQKPTALAKFTKDLQAFANKSNKMTADLYSLEFEDERQFLAIEAALYDIKSNIEWMESEIENLKKGFIGSK